MNAKTNKVNVPDESPREEPAPAKLKLPAGLTQELVDGWKRLHPKVAMARVAGVHVVYRPISREEFLAAREGSKSEEALTDALLTKSVLWTEDKPAATSAGFRSGVASSIADLSEARDCPLYLVDEEILGRWDDIMSRLPEDKRIDVRSYLDRHDPLWVMLTDDQVYLMTFVAKTDYDHVMEKNPEVLEDRMIQHGVIYPRMATADLRRLPYGRYQSIYSNLMITTGFNPEPAVLL